MRTVRVTDDDVMAWPGQVLLSMGGFCPSPCSIHRLGTFSDGPSCGWGWCWHLVVEDGDAAKHRTRHRTASTRVTRPNASRAEVKLWSGMTLEDGVRWAQIGELL